MPTPSFDFAPLAGLLAIAAFFALPIFAAVAWRQRNAVPAARMAALTGLALFLTFDLIVFGAFTRLSDSGLGCPDWPGCYAATNPIAAHDDIRRAEAATPAGPVTWTKAWIEMVHRYLAMVVGALVAGIAALGVLWRRRLRHSPGWPLATLAWVVVQGLFGAYTVTMKLYPAVVTLHLLGGLVLLALLAVQHRRDRAGSNVPFRGVALQRAVLAAGIALFVQIALGGWVSSNYAVIACSGFPRCNGQWWPAMDLASGFAPLRELGRSAQGGALGIEALVAIQMVHRLFAAVATVAVAALAFLLLRLPGAEARRYGSVLLVLLALQIASGLSNVVLGWPLAGALGHTACAAGMVALLATLWARGRTVPGGARPTMQGALAGAA